MTNKNIFETREMRIIAFMHSMRMIAIFFTRGDLVGQNQPFFRKKNVSFQVFFFFCEICMRLQLQQLRFLQEQQSCTFRVGNLFSITYDFSRKLLHLVLDSHSPFIRLVVQIFPFSC